MQMLEIELYDKPKNQRSVCSHRRFFQAISLKKNMESNQIYLSVLKTAIQKSMNKYLPQILNDVVEYLENHDIQVKQRKKRSKSQPLQNIEDLQKKTQSISAKKIKTTPFFNLNTNRVVSKKIGEKYPNLQFGKVTQNNKTVWVCGTPGHLQNTLNTLKQSDEKTEPIFRPSSPMKPIEAGLFEINNDSSENTFDSQFISMISEITNSLPVKPKKNEVTRFLDNIK